MNSHFPADIHIGIVVEERIIRILLNALEDLQNSDILKIDSYLLPPPCMEFKRTQNGKQADQL